jgi:hypothetical protein
LLAKIVRYIYDCPISYQVDSLHHNTRRRFARNFCHFMQGRAIAGNKKQPAPLSSQDQAQLLAQYPD